MGYSSIVIFRYLELPRLSCSPRPEQKQLRCSQVTDAKEGEEERKVFMLGPASVGPCVSARSGAGT